MNSPNEIEERINTTLNAWQTLADKKTFGGMTLADFQAIVQTSLADRSALQALHAQVTNALAQRNADDIASMAAVQAMVKGVVADPDEGDNSALYKALGYIPKSERRSGLTRKKKPVPPPVGLQLLDKAA